MKWQNGEKPTVHLSDSDTEESDDSDDFILPRIQCSNKKPIVYYQSDDE